MFKFALIFSGVRVIRSLDFCVMFVDRCLCFCAFSLAYWHLRHRKYLFINVWRKSVFDIYVTEYGTVLTTILPILFLYLNTVIVTAETFEP
jgi:hypothetical protein